MNKNEFLRAIADKTGDSLKATGEYYDAFVAVVAEELKKGEKVTLVGFGTFEAKKKAARVYKNPQTGKDIKAAACNSPAFKFGKSFKDSIN
jgi:DNA-binding protein HU-beta